MSIKKRCHTNRLWLCSESALLVTRGHRVEEEEDARIEALPETLRPSEDLRFKVSFEFGARFLKFLNEIYGRFLFFSTFISHLDAAFYFLP